jgi:hypothetical protein
MGYAEHDDATDVEATRAFLVLGPAYPEASAHAGNDRYAGYERFTGDVPPPFTRTYARPVTRTYARPVTRTYARPVTRACAEPGCPWQGVQSVVQPTVQPTGRPLAERLYRLRPDRLVLAGGSLAAAAAVAIAFATAGGSATQLPPRTAATHAAQPACVSPAPGR